MHYILKKLLSIQDLDQLTTQELTELLHLLVQNEIQPGGPYRFDDVSNDRVINAHIYELFAAKGKWLNPSMAPDWNSFRNTHTTKVTNQKKSKTRSSSLFKTVYSYLHKSVNLKDERYIFSIIKRIEQGDCFGEMSLLTEAFYDSIKQEYRPFIHNINNVKAQYSLANIYTWISYSLIDTILDDQSSCDLFPVANLLGRRSLYHYTRAGVPIELIESLFNKVDNANLYELSVREYVKVDTFQNEVIIYKNNFSGLEELTAHKSIAHTIGPIHIGKVAYKNDSKKIYRAMLLYCSARQINDDLHDWVEDFSRGQITYVIVCLLNELNISPGKYLYSDLVDDMKKVFWSKVLIQCSNKVAHKIESAKKLLESTILEKNSQFVTVILNPILSSALETIKKREEEETYIKLYADTSN